MDQDIYRGDIFYIEYEPTVGSEQRSGRPGIVVSNDKNNAFSSTVEVVYLTTQPKNDLPTHVVIKGTGRISTALCEQITTCSKERIGAYISSCTEKEINEIDKALMISLGCQPAIETEPVCTNGVGRKDNEIEKIEKFATLSAERDIYKRLYEELISKVVGA